MKNYLLTRCLEAYRVFHVSCFAGGECKNLPSPNEGGKKTLAAASSTSSSASEEMLLEFKALLQAGSIRIAPPFVLRLRYVFQVFWFKVLNCSKIPARRLNFRGLSLRIGKN